MPGMTITEKILAKHSGKGRVAPAENVWVNVDILMTHDVCGPGTIGIFHEKFGRQAKVWDRDRVVRQRGVRRPDEFDGERPDDVGVLDVHQRWHVADRRRVPDVPHRSAGDHSAR